MASRKTPESLEKLSGYKGLDLVVETALKKANLAEEPVAYQTVSQVTLPERQIVRTITPIVQTPPVITTERNCNFLPPVSLDQYKLNSDPNPEVVRKRPNDKIRYQQEVAVRFLEPPKPPKPGDIVVKQLPNRQIAPAPPLVVRQAPPRPSTPAPLVIREAPPKAPQVVSEQVVLVPGKVIPPPSRKVVVERLPPIPPKPKNIFLEKWLPFKQAKRRVVHQRPEPDCVLPNPKNVVIQWEAPEVEVRRVFKNLGKTVASPDEYLRRFGTELLKHEDFKKAASKLGAPEELIVSNSHIDLGLPELEGDLESLRFVDLDKAGLTQYKSFLSNLGVRTNLTRSSNGLGFITSTDSSNLISIDQARDIVNNLNGGTKKLYSDAEIRAYFNALDKNKDGVLSLDELRDAL